jgi:hypothetical protein
MTTRRSFFKTLAGLTGGLFASKAAGSPSAVTKLEAVDASFAVSSRDLAAAFARAGSAADAAGVSFGTLTKQVVIAQEVTSRGGTVIGNALRTVYERLRDSDTLVCLRQHGLSRDTPDDLLKAISAKWPTLAPKDKNAVAELLGGVRQINTVKVIFSLPI